MENRKKDFGEIGFTTDDKPEFWDNYSNKAPKQCERCKQTDEVIELNLVDGKCKKCIIEMVVANEYVDDSKPEIIRVMREFIQRNYARSPLCKE